MTKRQVTLIAKALADPRRFEILECIARCSRETSCSDLRDKFPITAATLSHHLKELSNAGLITARRDSKFVYLQLKQDVWDGYLKHLAKLGR